jgi:YHS domain-containing protein
MAKDPVCGIKVTEGHAAGRSEYQGRLYFFCSLACKQQFAQDPQHYSRLARMEAAKPEEDAEAKSRQ